MGFVRRLPIAALSILLACVAAYAQVVVGELGVVAAEASKGADDELPAALGRYLGFNNGKADLSAKRLTLVGGIQVKSAYAVTSGGTKDLVLEAEVAGKVFFYRTSLNGVLIGAAFWNKGQGLRGENVPLEAVKAQFEEEKAVWIKCLGKNRGTCALRIAP